MPITLNYQPAAAAVAGLALTGGQGEYAKWLNDYKLRAWQAQTDAQMQAAQMAQGRQLALAQMSNQNQQQQNQQSFDLQRMPFQAQLESQQQAYHAQLQLQNQQTLQAQQGQIHAEQSTQDYGEAQKLQEAQGQIHAENLQTQQYYADQLKRQQQIDKDLQNPLDEHIRNVKGFTDQGYSFSPGLKQIRDNLIKQVQGLQQAGSDGPGATNSRGDTYRAMKPLIDRLKNIVPDQPPPETVSQKIAKSVVMGVPGPDGKPLPGTEKTPFTVDKDGTPMVVRSWKSDASGGATTDVDGVTMPIDVAKKMEGLKDLKEKREVKRQANIDREFNEAVTQQGTIDMQSQTAFARDPAWREQLKQTITARHQQAGLNADQQAGSLESEVRGRMSAADAQQQQVGGPPPGSPPAAYQPPAAAGQAPAAPAPAQPPAQAPPPPTPGIPGQPPAQAQPAQAQPVPDIRSPQEAHIVIQHVESLPQPSVTDLLMLRRAKLFLQTQNRGAA